MTVWDDPEVLKLLRFDKRTHWQGRWHEVGEMVPLTTPELVAAAHAPIVRSRARIVPVAFFRAPA